MNSKEWMFLNRIEIILSILFTLIGIIGWCSGFFKWLWENRYTHYYPLGGKPTPKIIICSVNSEQPSSTASWHMGAQGNQELMIINARFLVTNNTNHPILLTGSELKRAKARGKVLTENSRGEHDSRYQISPGQTAQILIFIIIQPPFKKIGEIFTSDVVIYDNFGGKNIIKKVNFIYL